MGMRQEESSEEAPNLWVVVEDHLTKVFGVFGPLSDDGEWTTRVRLARERGRDLTICTVASKLDAKRITDQLAGLGFTNNQVAIRTRVGA